MKTAILGMGCATCNKLEDTVRLAIKETGIMIVGFIFNWIY
jgi:hypothetical protein